MAQQCLKNRIFNTLKRDYSYKVTSYRFDINVMDLRIKFLVTILKMVGYVQTPL